jgi:hypothetical protein
MFEQQLKDFIAQLVLSNIIISGDLTGVNEVTFVGEAKAFILTNGFMKEEKIYFYKVNDVIQYKFISTTVDKEKIIVETPIRIANDGESLPIKEVVEEPNKYIQIRYDYFETLDNGVRYFNFKYVDVLENTRDCIINTMIRLKYTQDQENAIMRKRLMGMESLEFLKFNNWVNYSKGVADGSDLTSIKSATTQEIVMPLHLCNLGYDYGNLAFSTLIKNITFEADSVNDIGKAYPSWISETDLAMLSQDPRLTITLINLYDENYMVYNTK